MENIIECINLTHKYGNRLVFKDMNFNIEKGKIFGILGKNGMGKTTTINIMMGFLRPTSGKIMILGEESHKLSPRTRAKIGLLHEGHLAYDFMTVEQVEKFYSKFFPAWNKRFYYELMDIMKMNYDHKVGKMSCGQRSQVALGLIMAQDPELMILDDYSMGLDAGYRMLFIDYLMAYVRDHKKTVFMTSHIIQDMEKVIDDVIVMGYQKILLQKPIKEFLQNFHKFIFTSADDIKLKQDEVVANTESLKNTYTLYSFKELNDIKKYLDQKNITYSNLIESTMVLEEAFIGLTGKY